MNKFIYFDEYGRACMVDVGGKVEIVCVVVVLGCICMFVEVFVVICDGDVFKGDVLVVVCVVGIMVVKKMVELILFCYLFVFDVVMIDFVVEGDVFCVIVIVLLSGRMGVEMEVMIVICVVFFMVYDMVKVFDKGMVVDDVWLIEKCGGKLGYWWVV